MGGCIIPYRESFPCQCPRPEIQETYSKTLDEFNFSSAPHIPAGKLKELAEGGYIARAEPVLFIGDLVRAEERTAPLHPVSAPRSFESKLSAGPCGLFAILPLTARAW